MIWSPSTQTAPTVLPDASIDGAPGLADPGRESRIGVPQVVPELADRR